MRPPVRSELECVVEQVENELAKRVAIQLELDLPVDARLDRDRPRVGDWLERRHGRANSSPSNEGSRDNSALRGACHAGEVQNPVDELAESSRFSADDREILSLLVAERSRGNANVSAKSESASAAS